MDQLLDFADPRLINGCVFCGSRETEPTRDHVPSRVLLDPPFPANLPVVDACHECNNGLSLDEEYLACLLDCTIAGSTEPDRMSREVVRKILGRKPELRDRIERSRRISGDRAHFMPEVTRVNNVVRKLARGHAAFELSTPMRREPDVLRWWALPSMDRHQLEDFDAAHVHHLVGEIGSRATQRIMVVPVMSHSLEGEPIMAPLLVSDWVKVQEGRYRYLAVDDVGGSRIKIVIGEYLACEVIWSWNHEQCVENTASGVDARRDLDAQLELWPKA